MSLKLVFTLLLLVCFTVFFCNAAKMSKKFLKSLKNKRQDPLPGECGNYEFRCKNSRCIQLEWTCDTDNDCGDRRDEVDCPTDCSGDHQYLCKNTRCIPTEFLCDAENDCGDNSDENRCNTIDCPVGEIKCSNNICIKKAYLCNRVNDCGNGWDEVPTNCDIE